MTITLNINGQPVNVTEGAMALDAINASGTYIPPLCKDPDMPAIGACRTCLVQIDGVRGFPASCSVPAQEGMAISTDHPLSVSRGSLMVPSSATAVRSLRRSHSCSAGPPSRRAS